MKLHTLLLLALALTLVGCASEPPLQTRSGRPEVTIHNRSLAQVRAAATNHFVDKGWGAVKTEGTQLVFERQGGATESFLMGLMTDNPQSTNRITVTLIENGSDVRVVAGIAAIGANTFGRAQVVELSGKGYQQVQAELQAIKSRVEARE